MSVRLFVGNLPYDTTEEDLRQFFSPVGSLSTVIIPTDRETGKPRGFAFVEFSDPAQAEEATRQLNNQSLKGRTIAINEARARENRSSTGLGGRPGNPMRPAGMGRTNRSGSTQNRGQGGPNFGSDPMEIERSSRAERRNRNFRPNAKPSRKRKSQHKSRGEMGGKRGPIRDRVGGQFFGSYEDDLYEDDRDLDYMADFRDSE
jgi:RNA recognition motif-containing protein